VNLERIADYELVEYLTAGGMADLYLARSPRQPAPVVLKTIQKKYVDLTRVVKMFIDEGRIAKALDHPNIVRIHDVGEERGAYFIAMELINGRDLLAIARRGIEAGRFLPMHLAAAIVAQVATGLCYAHEKRDGNGTPLRIVHCDVSPGNVVVSFGGTAKIVDFGIARATIQLRAEDHTVAGKFNYMAPEQIRGDTLDARADIFSLGVILYELTVGRRLFRGRPDDVKRRILDGDVPRPSEVRPELPPTLENIILRALASDRDERYARARDLRADLLAFIGATSQPAGKREIAEYLRSIFVDTATQATESDASGAFAPDTEDDPDLAPDLTLDAPVPGLAELVVDPDDPEPAPLPAPLSASMSEDSREPEPEPREPEPPEPETKTKTVPLAAESDVATKETLVPPASAPRSDDMTVETELPRDPVTAPSRMPPSAPSVMTSADRPRATRAELTLAAVAIFVAILLYWLARS
jgi:serine/threonine-protein kinase